MDDLAFWQLVVSFPRFYALQMTRIVDVTASEAECSRKMLQVIFLVVRTVVIALPLAVIVPIAYYDWLRVILAYAEARNLSGVRFITYYQVFVSTHVQWVML